MLLVKFAKLENFQANNRLLQYSGQIRKKLQGLNFKGSEKVHEKIAVNNLFKVPINLQTSIKFLKKTILKFDTTACLTDDTNTLGQLIVLLDLKVKFMLTNHS